MAVLLLIELIAIFVIGVFLYGLWKLLRAQKEETKQLRDQLHHHLQRSEGNPILEKTQYPWEGAGVINPAAVEAGGRVHLFYRAIGDDGVSRVGYASSVDGVNFDDRLPHPVFALQDPHPSPDVVKTNFPQLIASGGTWAGVEDPRAVIIDDRLYLTFSAFGGWDSLRMGVTSIAVDDMLNKKWKWSFPRFLSPKGQIHKNWILFPEKINGKFAILHNLHAGDTSKVRVEYIDDFHTMEASRIESADPNALRDNPCAWHKRMRGAGPPPLRTPNGWLLLYHGNDHETHKYKMGAMLLDLKDPSKVIARSEHPILVPEAHYENEGFKPGIVYACGAVIRDSILRVYYGGADEVVCTASANLHDFVASLTATRQPALAPAFAFTTAS